MNRLIQDLVEINRRLSFELWHLGCVNGRPSGLSPRMLLPERRNGERRLGEHEPMILYCGLLNSLNYYYLTQNPGEATASADLNLYAFRDETFQKVAGVEFKAHNPRQEAISSDIRKLIRGRTPSNWFHILEDLSEGALGLIFQKLMDSLRASKAEIQEGSKVSILFCFCALEKKWAALKHFFYDASRGDFDAYASSFFDLEYSIESDQVMVSKGIDWYIFQVNPEGFIG